MCVRACVRVCVRVCVCVCVYARAHVRERENSNSKTLFYNHCNIGSVKT